MKRQRGRGRKPGGGGGGNHNHNHGNRSLESNGPDVKIRGTAAQIYEKYSQYARDAQSGGDRVKYENYLQHAEHYYRVMAASMPRERLLQQQNGEGGFTSGQQMSEGSVTQTGEGGAPQQGEQQHEPIKAVDGSSGDDRDDDADGDEGEGNGGGEEVEAGAREDNRGEGEQGERQGRNRRGRRRRRPQDGEPQGERPAGGDPEARSALDSLARKQGALAGG